MNGNIYDLFEKEELNKLHDELKDWDDYVPLLLLHYVDRRAYFKRWSDEAKEQYHIVRHNQPSNSYEYFKKDIMDWINEHPQFKHILKK